MLRLQDTSHVSDFPRLDAQRDPTTFGPVANHQEPGRPSNETVYQHPAEIILNRSQAGRSVIQDFRPLSESLEWKLGQEYWHRRGSKAFVSDYPPVPFAINNDGALSRHAADLFFTSLVEQEKEASLERDIFVLELGIGVGLFARYFLDWFRDLCILNAKDYYHRLCYILGDWSELMLADICRNGLLANHPGRYCLRIVDALDPEKYLNKDAIFGHHRGKVFRAVFLNYVLDCLPATVLDISNDHVKQLCVRTCIARNVNLEEYTDLSPEVLAERARYLDAGGEQELLEVYGLFASEYKYQPAELSNIPYSDFAVELARPVTKRILHNFGAIQSLERLLELVHVNGFVLINDYGQIELGHGDDFEHQRFSLATAVGLNFALLKAYFREVRKSSWIEPLDEKGHIYSRLLSHKPGPETVTSFQERFGKATYEWSQAPWEKARECIKAGRFELAATFYQRALGRQPNNWMLLNEISSFLTLNLRDSKGGLEMAKVALSLNPNCCSDLWCTLGDALVEFSRLDEARAAYLRAVKLNGNDLRGHYSLARVHAQQKDFPAALNVIAQALALDRTGAFRESLLQRQSEVLGMLADRYQQENLLRINSVIKYANTDQDNLRKSELTPIETRNRTLDSLSAERFVYHIK